MEGRIVTWRSFVGSAVFLAFISTGCFNDSDSADSTTIASSAAEGVASQDGVGSLPVGWYLVDASHQREVIQMAQGKLIRECMAAQGFEYVVPEYHPDEDFLGKRYGVDVETASRIGFLSLDYLNDGFEEDAPLEPQTDDSPEFTAALFGNSEETRTVDVGADGIQVAFTEGCVGAARRELFDSDEGAIAFNEMDMAIQQVDLSAYYEALASPGVVAALNRWVECMASSGYQYPDRDSLLNTTWPDPRPTREEIDVAVADATCLASVDYRTTMMTESARIQSEMLSDGTVNVEDFRTARDELIAKAENIIND